MSYDSFVILRLGVPICFLISSTQQKKDNINSFGYATGCHCGGLIDNNSIY